MRITELETPSLVVDREKLDANFEAVDALLRDTCVRMRPHYKSHKCSMLAHEQMEAGAVGMTCAKLSEAEDLVYSGIGDILIANQIVELTKITRLAELAKKCRLTVCVDSEENAEMLSQAAVNANSTICCLVEYEIGMRRCGVTTVEEYVRLATKISALPNLQYMGVQAYAGYASHIVSAQERKTVTEANLNKVRELVNCLKNNGLNVQIVSGASTGTCGIVALSDVYTEMQAGSYLFMDSTYNKLGLPFVNSLFVLSTVISKREGIAILDVGAKGLGTDQNLPEIVKTDGTPVTGEFVLNEEHLKVYNASAELRIGEKVFVIPGHCCTTVNLYNELYFFKGDRIVNRYAITARGCSR